MKSPYTRTTDEFRLSILILAHKNFDQVVRLINRLSHEKVDIFIHADKKWILTEEQIFYLRSMNGGNVWFCNERFSIYLFDYSMVKAELELIKTAYTHSKANCNRYYVLLSGQDYPIHSIDYIVSELEKSYPRPYIDTTMWHSNNWVSNSFGKVTAYKRQQSMIKTYINNHIRISTLNVVLRGFNYLFFSSISKIKQVLFKTPYKRIRNLTLEMAGGSQWFILPEYMAIEPFKYTSNRQFMGIFKDVGSADETFFQTVLVNSPFKNELTINRWDETEQKTRTYTDFYGDSSVSIGHPIILTKKNYKDIYKSDYLFARKFDEKIDNEILDLIDNKMLLSKEEN